MNQSFIVRSGQNGSGDDRWIPRPARINGYMSTNQSARRPVVHLELHTADLARASAFCSELLQWEPKLIRVASSSYLALDLGSSLGGGIVECVTRRPVWLPYVGPYRAQLRAHCYRMLASLPDADDALQETLLRAWRGLDRFEGRSSLRSWLYTIATNASLRTIERRPRRVLPVDYAPAADPHDLPAGALTESVWLEPYPDGELGVADDLLGPDARYEQRESIELAFTAALQHLPARQRAVLILRDVLGFSARETAEVLETTPVSVDSALQRAHKTVDERVPDRSQQATLRALGDSEVRELVNRFAQAWESHDVGTLVAMLAEDARMTMPPQPSWYQGRDAIAEFLGRWPLSPVKRFQLFPISANGQPAAAAYIWDEQTGAFEAESIIVLAFRDDGIEEITAFRTPELFPLFGLPEQPPTDPPDGPT